MRAFTKAAERKQEALEAAVEGWVDDTELHDKLLEEGVKGDYKRLMAIHSTVFYIQLLKNNPENTGLFATLGHQLQTARFYPEAEKAYRQALEFGSNERQPYVQNALTEVLTAQHKYREALDLVYKLKKASENGGVYNEIIYQLKRSLGHKISSKTHASFDDGPVG